MIENQDAAAKALAAAFEAAGILDRSIHHVIAAGTAEEITAYKRAVGNVLAEIMARILSPIIAEHPALAPEGWASGENDA